MERWCSIFCEDGNLIIEYHTISALGPEVMRHSSQWLGQGVVACLPPQIDPRHFQVVG